MKRLPKYLSTFAFALVIWGAFSVAEAHAAILLQQTQGNYEGPATTTPGFQTYKIGQGNLIGQVSQVSIKGHFVFTNGAEYVGVQIEGYPDATYSGATDVCGYNATPAAYGIGSVNGIVTSNNSGCATGDGIFSVNQYVKIIFTMNTSGSQTRYGVPASVSPFTLDGFDYWGVTPYIVVEGINSSLNPNLINGGNPSGISTSTIQAFCNGTYATSTGFFSDIANGVTYGACTAFAFLFVPNQDTLQDFHNLSSTTQSKIPFSYGYDIATIFSGLTASSSQNFPTYSIGLNAIDFSSSTAMGPIFPTSLDFLSSTTINRFLPAGMHDILYSFAIFVIWVETAFVLYRKIVPIKAKI